MKLSLWRKDTLAHESLIVGIMLALSGGFLDTYTYTLRGGVFANAQTGNLVLMAVKLADFDFLSALYYFIPVTAFFLGVLLSGGCRKTHFCSGSSWRCCWKWCCC